MMAAKLSISDLEVADGLHARKVSKTFVLSSAGEDHRTDRHVFENVDFVLRPGQITGLVGRTGVGKTTLGKIMGGLYRPDSGAVLVGAYDLAENRGSRARLIRKFIRYTPQNPDAVLSHRVTVGAAVREAQAICRLSNADSRRWTGRVLALPLFKQGWMHRRFGELSLGERRRVINLRSIQTCPRFLIMDEPFNGLDLHTRGAMLKLMRVAADEMGVGILIISHDVPSLREVCDRIKLLSEAGIISYQMEKKK